MERINKIIARASMDAESREHIMERHITRQVYDKVIGIDHQGHPLSSIYIIISPSGRVVMAYPAKGHVHL